MKKGVLVGLMVVMGALFFDGCATTKMSISSIRPAEVKGIKKDTTVAVVDFKNDYAGRLSSLVQEKLSNKTFNGEQYLKTVSRGDIVEVLQDQQLQSGDIVDTNTAVMFGKVTGVNFLVTGSVDGSSWDREYIQDNTRCVSYYKDTHECRKFERYDKVCHVIKAEAQSTMSLVDVEKGVVIYSKPYTKVWDSNDCRSSALSSNFHVSNAKQALSRLYDEIATDFVNRITPTFQENKVEIIEDCNYDLTSSQKHQFRTAVEYIKQNRAEKAADIFENLHIAVGQKSYEIAYNYGVLQESAQNYAKAYQLYMLAERLVVVPNPLISQAVVRVKSMIDGKSLLKEQL